MPENIIGSQIKKLRGRFRMSQPQLADKIGVSKQTVSNWETGLKSPRMGKVQQLSDLFDVSINYIIKGEEDNFNTEKQISYFVKMLDRDDQEQILKHAMRLYSKKS